MSDADFITIIEKAYEDSCKSVEPNSQGIIDGSSPEYRTVSAWNKATTNFYKNILKELKANV